MCGGANAGDARYCSRCGALLVSVTPARVSARKVVTVLFSDVRGFTELGERLDPESLHELIGRWFYETHHVIARHGGTVEKFMGDAVMAVFGVPVVHEDDALERRGRRSRWVGRSWISTRSLCGAGECSSKCAQASTPERSSSEKPLGRPTTLGDAVNVAQRLENSAPPGQVLIGEDTARLVKRTRGSILWMRSRSRVRPRRYRLGGWFRWPGASKHRIA